MTTTDPRLQTRADAEQDIVRRFVAYQDLVTYFGSNSVARAIFRGISGLAANGPRLLRALIRRSSLLQATGSDLVAVLEERGTPQRGALRASVLLVLQPHATVVLDITTGGGSSDIEVEDATNFEAGDSLRLVSADGATTETMTIDTVGTVDAGPNGGTVITTTAAAVHTYAPTTERVVCLLRYTVPAETLVRTLAGVTFQTLSAVTVGDRNPVLAGESTALALCDKVWAECTVKGAKGNIDVLQVSDFASALPKVKRVLNPERGIGGEDVEPDYEAKYRSAHYPSVQAIETNAWFLARAQELNEDVLRTVPTRTPSLRGMRVRVLTRSGGALSTSAKLALQTGLDARLRSSLSSEIVDVTMTAVEVDVTATLSSGASIDDAFVELCSNLAAFLDFRTWEWGRVVDDADLLSITNATAEIDNVDTTTFEPSGDVSVGLESLPYLARVTLRDSATGNVRGADLTQDYSG